MRFILKKYDKVLFVFFVAMLISSFLIWAFEERFDQDDWRSSPSTRYKMAEDLIDSELLIGKSKDDVIVLLGTFYDTNPNGKDNIIYKLGKAPSFFESKVERLFVVFENEIVTKVIHSED
ncbi:MAG: hypothetical protein V7719_00940 [Psychroserpens sp.]|uniref:hypothetical protein n=1 Tax=Psychroserpens sp. TaxID=2020870 RepID=UPI003002876D